MADFTALDAAAQSLIDAASVPLYTQIADQKTQIAGLNTQVADLKTQLAAAQSKPNTTVGHVGPVVDFAASIRAADPLNLNFDADATVFADGATGTQFAWDFGQSTYTGTGPAAHNYTYNKPGVYTVKLTVTDTLGGVGTAIKQITVGSDEDIMVYFKGTAVTVYIYNPLLGTKRALSDSELALVKASNPSVAIATLTDAQVTAIKSA